jgi:hypothetical protein
MMRTSTTVILVAFVLVGCSKPSSDGPAEADKRLDRALAQKSYGSLMLFLKDRPKSPRAAEARKAADAIAAEAIQSYLGAAKGAKGAEAIKEALQSLHKSGRSSVLFACEHRFPEQVKVDVTGALAEHIKHGKELAYERLREIASRLGTVLRNRTNGAFGVFRSSVYSEKVTEPTLALQTTLGESAEPMVTNKGRFARLEMKLVLRLLRPGKEPLAIVDELVEIPKGFAMNYSVMVKPGESADRKDPSYLLYNTMRKRLWDSVAGKVYAALALGST